jgi:hypothetical protein
LEEVFPDEEILVHAGRGIFDEGFILIGNEEDSDGWVVQVFADFGAVVVEVGIKLAGILVGEGSDFQLNEDVAFEDAMVEDEIDKEVFLADEDALLAGLEAKAMAEFEEEAVEVVEKGGFEIGLLDGEVIWEAEELEGVEVLREV